MKSRQRLPSISSDDGAEIFDVEDFDNGYLKDAKRQLLHFAAMSTIDFKKSLEIITQLTLMCWMGGPVVQAAITTSVLYPQLYTWIRDKTTPFASSSDWQVFRFHEAVVELMIILCYGSRINQNQMRKMGWLELLIELTSHPRSKMKKLAVTCLLFLLMNNTANQFWVLKVPKIQDRITAVVNENWADYSSNYADDLLNLLDLAQNTIKSGNGCESLASLFERIVRH